MSVGSGEIIAPVKPILQLDLDSFPASSMDTPMESVLAQVKENRVDEDDVDESEDDEIVISGSLPKVKGEENVLHIDLEISESDESDSISTILSKAVISRHIKEQEQEVARSANEILEQTPKKTGLFSVFSKKKPVIPKTTDATDNDQGKPIPLPKDSKTPAPEKEKGKKSGFFSGFSKRKPAVPNIADATDDNPDRPVPVPEKTKKEKKVKTVESSKMQPSKSFDPMRKKSILTKILIFLGPILIVALGTLCYWEHTQVNAEREEVAKWKKEAESLRRQVNNLRKDQTPPTTEEPDVSVDKDVSTPTLEPATAQDLSEASLEF